MTTTSQRIALVFLLFAPALLATAYAGTSDTALAGAANKVYGWLGGYLGKSIAGTALLLGVVIAAINGKFVPALVGIGIAAFLAFLPSMISGGFMGNPVYTPVVTTQTTNLGCWCFGIPAPSYFTPVGTLTTSSITCSGGSTGTCFYDVVTTTTPTITGYTGGYPALLSAVQ